MEGFAVCAGLLPAGTLRAVEPATSVIARQSSASSARAAARPCGSCALAHSGPSVIAQRPTTSLGAVSDHLWLPAASSSRGEGLESRGIAEPRADARAGCARAGPCRCRVAALRAALMGGPRADGGKPWEPARGRGTGAPLRCLHACRRRTGAPPYALGRPCSSAPTRRSRRLLRVGVSELSVRWRGGLARRRVVGRVLADPRARRSYQRAARAQRELRRRLGRPTRWRARAGTATPIAGTRRRQRVAPGRLGQDGRLPTRPAHKLRARRDWTPG
jgi:hypothetical protein